MVILTGIALISIGCVGTSYLTPDNYLAHQGFVELSKGNYSMAEANLKVSLDIEPNNPYSLLNLGAVYQNTGRTWQAAMVYEKLIELNPEQTAIESNIAGYKGRSLVEIARENLKLMAVNDSLKGSTIEPFDIDKHDLKVSDKNTLPIVSEDHLPPKNDTIAIFASTLNSLFILSIIISR
jgi:tetratricopeptide (TPR) repeat protein